VVPLASDYAQAKYLTVAEVAGLLRVSNMTVYRLIEAGDLPAGRVGKSFRIREVDLDKYLADSFNQAV
jgi:excisionase family DNA binding protein